MSLSETPDRLEPMILTDISPEITETVAELAALTAVLGKALHPHTARELTAIVRIMNCYYSNLIEGHHTRPREIERALNGEMDADPRKRDLQIEAVAHIEVQELLDKEIEGDATQPDPASTGFIRFLHESFYWRLPEEMRLIKGRDREFLMEPGVFRTAPEHDVEVGRHVPPSSDRVEAFMARFSEVYAAGPLGSPTRQMLAVPAAHHRLAYIHPFADGNGRVARLMTHAMILKAGFGAHGLWAISRGLARGLSDKGEYKAMLALADAPRQGDRDGRGNLSLKALNAFTLWFLKVCLDQVTYMSGLFDLRTLADRLTQMVHIDPYMKPEAAALLRAALHRGEFPRGEARAITGLAERTARDVLSMLVQRGLLGSENPKGPVSLRFPTRTHEVLFPRLFVDVEALNQD
ncbi:MAG: Fic family protein [Caulobacter sp.]|nr:Fic family protein [Caulobacter sp.]